MPEGRDLALIIWVAVAGLGWLVFTGYSIRRVLRDRHESRVQQRIAHYLREESEARLSPEERQRREAQRRHLASLRARAEAELAVQRRRPWWPWPPRRSTHDPGL